MTEPLRLQMTEPLRLRGKLIEVRSAFYKGEATWAAVLDAADAYLDAVVAHQRAKGVKRVKRPSRAYIIRAV